MICPSSCRSEGSLYLLYLLYLLHLLYLPCLAYLSLKCRRERLSLSLSLSLASPRLASPRHRSRMAVASPQLMLGSVLAKREREEARIAASVKVAKVEEPQPEEPAVFEDCQY